ncbi:putative carbohydrate-binding protein [Phytophthora cinnamomi]|uniref:putative carbohydrate-binding protein n=1 Tax=Phytophthora cinnamomi TaxID=4785 RepID=UPI00355964C6|nr:putative carbohydrate-binding protein [Phytophthora cinnamomi]
MTISMTDVNGNSIEDTVSLTADSCTEGSNQFPSGGSSQTSQQSSPTYNNPTPTTAAPTKAPTTAPPTQAPTPSPTPTPTQTPVSTTQAPSPTTDSETASGSDAANQHFNVSGTVEPEATTAPTKAGKTSKTSGNDTPTTSDDDYTHQQAQQKAGVPAATTAAPSTEQQTTDSQANGDEAQKANTKSGETSAGTDPLIIVLSTVGAVGLVALIVVVVVVKRKNIQEQKARDFEAPSMISAQSFDVQNTPSDRRQAFGIL